VLDPPLPRKLVEMPPLTDNNESNRQNVYSIAAARFFGTFGAIEGRIASVLGPKPRLADDVALRALKPTRKADADKLPCIVPIYTRGYLRSDGRKPETVHAKLLLKPRLENSLGMPKSTRRRPTIPFL
jgi:hypothetical protein